MCQQYKAEAGAIIPSQKQGAEKVRAHAPGSNQPSSSPAVVTANQISYSILPRLIPFSV